MARRRYWVITPGLICFVRAPESSDNYPLEQSTPLAHKLS